MTTLYYVTDKFHNADPFDTLEEARLWVTRRMSDYENGYGPASDPLYRIVKVQREDVENYHYEKGVGTVVTPKPED